MIYIVPTDTKFKNLVERIINMYTPKHSKLERNKIFTYHDLEDKLNDIFNDLNEDDIFILPFNFFTDLKEYLKMSNTLLDGKLNIKRIKKYEK